ncbi:cephalosporin hydroxylase family protein [Sporomusa malonica]|uniref:Cephalosporin hydroxylase n=1 Tax=Sporomusa malonica TaxID=112901 RepID=A0A1W2EW79_9FIRM|nr:CmcI family methyltransferase [Sporomusa malonica]SMD13468.1 Cephalosporin hydroxylase [Sporomusa malonica]
MRIIIDDKKKELSYEHDNVCHSFELYSKEAFEIITKQWVKIGWNQKYTYTFTWMGRPVIQLPEDMIRIQEVIYRVQPDLIIETGVAHGGSLVYYASLCKMMGKGRVIGIDIDIRPHNRQLIEEHELASYITLVEGNSIADNVIKKVKSFVKEGEKVLVILDSSHSREHVFNELEAYHDLVSIGSYIVVTDGLMQELYDVPRGNVTWQVDNPVSAVHDFLEKHKEFAYEKPVWEFNESELEHNITHWPMAWLKRVQE